MRRTLPHLFQGLLLAGVVLILQGCFGAMQCYQQGTKLEKAGFAHDAHAKYLQSWHRNSRSLSTRTALKRTSDALLTEKLGRFREQAFTAHDKLAAIAAYDDATAFVSTMERESIALTIPVMDQQDYRKTRSAYLDEAYQKAVAAVELDHFAEAQAMFGDICKMEPTYKDACALREGAIAEPLYRQGKAALDQNQYRRAYGLFDEALRKSSSYRDCRALMDTCIRKGSYTVMVTPVNSDYGTEDMGPWLQTRIIEELLRRKDPFLRVVDRQEVDALFAEHRFCMKGMVDPACATEAGHFLGARYVIVAAAQDMVYEDSGLDEREQDGFEWFTTEYYIPATDSQGNQLYDLNGKKLFLADAYGNLRTRSEETSTQVTYVEVQHARTVQLSLRWSAIDVRTSEVVSSGAKLVKDEEKMHYIRYDRNKDKLYSARRDGSRNTDRTEIRKLLNGTKEIASRDGLEDRIKVSAAKLIAGDVVEAIKKVQQ